MNEHIDEKDSDKMILDNKDDYQPRSFFKPSFVKITISLIVLLVFTIIIFIKLPFMSRIGDFLVPFGISVWVVGMVFCLAGLVWEFIGLMKYRKTKSDIEKERYENDANTPAVWALSMGCAMLVSISLFMVFLPFAIIFGIWGIVRAMKVKKGLKMSIVGMVLAIIFSAGWYYFCINAHAGCINAMSMTNLNGIGKAIQLYSSANDDKYPTRLELLIMDGYGSTKMFENPGQRGDLDIIDGKFEGELGYVIFLDIPDKSPGNMIMGYEKTKFAFRGKVAILQLNGKVKRMTIEELNKQLKAENRPPAE